VAAGTSTFTVTATNGVGPDVSALFTIVAARQTLALTGLNPTPELLIAALLLLAGAVLMTRGRLTNFSRGRRAAAKH
jgi:UPF0716 family protein affecting phage T7 exclusion